MELLYFAIPIGLLVGAIFLGAFIWAARSGQFDDLDTPAQRALHAPLQARRADSMPADPLIAQVEIHPSSHSIPSGTAAPSPATSICATGKTQ